MATNEQKLADIWWILCHPDGRASFASTMNLYSKGDAAYTNARVLDIVGAVGRIEGATTTLKTMVAAINTGNAAAIADAVVDAIGDDLAGEVATELGKRLNPGGAA